MIWTAIIVIVCLVGEFIGFGYASGVFDPWLERWTYENGDG